MTSHRADEYHRAMREFSRLMLKAWERQRAELEKFSATVVKAWEESK